MEDSYSLFHKDWLQKNFQKLLFFLSSELFMDLLNIKMCQEEVGL